jgi:predicted phosphodiesterase
MIHAVISDIHANAIALEAVLADAASCGAGSVVCLGDIVGYGPEPEKAVDAIRRSAAATVAGNHDDAVSGRFDPADFIDLAADAVARHREALSGGSIEWLKSLPYVFEGGTFVCAHGDFTSPKTFEYVIDEDQAAANFAARREQLMFVGHSHVPGIFVIGASGKVHQLAPADFTIEDGKRYIVNPGSVGYPRTDGGICESTYVLFDDKERTVTFRRLPFSVRSVMQTGRNPKRTRRLTIAAIATAAAIAAGAAAWFLAPDKRVETVTEVVTNSVTKVVERTVTAVAAIGHIDRHAECGIPNGTKKVALQVKLAKGSPAVQLQLLFQDAQGKTLGDERWTVKKSRKASVKVPPSAVKAILQAGRVDGERPAEFGEFAIAPAMPK